MGKLVVLMVTAFVDMMGGLIVFPLIPFYAERTLGHGPLWTALDAVGMGGTGTAVSLMVMMFPIAQLISAPYWGRFSDRFGIGTLAKSIVAELTVSLTRVPVFRSSV